MSRDSNFIEILVSYLFQIGIFAEGTRLTPAKLKASQEYALSKGIEPLKHHLLPRPKGFAVSVKALKDSGMCGTVKTCI